MSKNISYIKPKTIKDAEKLSENIEKLFDGNSYSSIAWGLSMAAGKLLDKLIEDQDDEKELNQIKVLIKTLEAEFEKRGWNLSEFFAE